MQTIKPYEWKIGSEIVTYCLTGKEADKLINAGLAPSFQDLSVGIPTGQIAIIPLDESNRENAQKISAVPEMYEALLAARAYDQAIAKRAEDGEVEIDARGAIAEGADLDTLYEDWITKSKKALRKAEGR